MADEQNINSTPNQESSEKGVRKLCAIMFTDIKDFSGKMQRDEVGTMRMLGIHNRMMTDAVHKYGGYVVKTIGDAFLVTFDSVVSATQCAVEVQQSFLQYNSQIKNEDEKITVRIGVHLGDVFLKENDVFGDGVNIASRVQSIAEVGGVNISESVYQQVRMKLNIKVLNLGVPQLKGIDQPIKVYQIIVIPTDKASGKFSTSLYVAKTILKRKKTKKRIAYGFASIVVLAAVYLFVLAPEPPPNSLAVIPFKYIGDPAEEYLSDAFTEDILSSVSRMKDIKVLSSGSSYRYKGSDKSEKEIAKELDVRYLLVGSIQTRGADITVRFRLTEPNEDVDVLNQDFDKARDELVSIRHDIIRQILLNFESKLSGEEKTSKEVYDSYLLGLGYDRKERKEDNQLAIAAFTQAKDKDPKFLPAYIKLASSQLLNHERGYDLNEKWLVESEGNIRKVLSIDSTNSEGYWLLGRLFIERGDHKQGVAYLERSIEMNPNLMRPYVTLGEEYAKNNDLAKGITYFTKAYELEPTNFNVSVNLGIANAMNRNYPDAEKSFKRAAALNPNHELPWLNLGYMYELMGEKDSAENAFGNALKRNPQDPVTGEHLAHMLLNRNRAVEADSVLTSVLKYEPSNTRLLYSLGIAQFVRGKINDAKQNWMTGKNLAEENAKLNPGVSEHPYFAALFSARLGDSKAATENAQKAIGIDSSENNVMGMCRVFAILSKKQEMLTWFGKARTMNGEYDASFIATDIDFKEYRNDPDLALAARR